jgi:hypothetical protein
MATLQARVAASRELLVEESCHAKRVVAADRIVLRCVRGAGKRRGDGLPYGYGGGYGQPSPTEGMPGAWQPSPARVPQATLAALNRRGMVDL